MQDSEPKRVNPNDINMGLTNLGSEASIYEQRNNQFTNGPNF